MQVGAKAGATAASREDGGMIWTRGVRVAAVASSATVLALSLVGCSDDGAGTEDAEDAPEGMVHVHGLGVNPADGSVRVASHYGAFVLDEDGDAARTGPVQDLMGFAVAGEDHFLASGHPGGPMLSDGAANPLGLVESVDGGATWTNLSLAGEADFHALTFAHDTIYGWSASAAALMVSTDGREWETRAEDISLASLAVDPDDPDRLVAVVMPASQIGEPHLEESTDGGRTWTEVPAPAGAVWLSWDANSGLWAADVEGGIHNTADPAQEWEHTGTLNDPPQALLAQDGTVYAATVDPDGMTAVLASEDGGDWDTLYKGP